VGLYVYCVVPPAHPLPADLTGIGGVAVEPMVIGDVALWMSRGERPEPGMDAIKAHNGVVEAAVTEAVTPLPLRFGQWLADERSLLEVFTEKAADYAARLTQIAGCMEFGIRLIDPAAPAEARVVQNVPHTSGLEYMRALQEGSRLADSKRQRAEHVHARVRELLQDLVREERVEEARTAHAVLTLSHLVARPHFVAYRERAPQIRELFPELRMLLSGPWPPYSFAV
jgi:hypothetical protein